MHTHQFKLFWWQKITRLFFFSFLLFPLLAIFTFYPFPCFFLSYHTFNLFLLSSFLYLSFLFYYLSPFLFRTFLYISFSLLSFYSSTFPFSLPFISLVGPFSYISLFISFTLSLFSCPAHCCLSFLFYNPLTPAALFFLMSFYVMSPEGSAVICARHYSHCPSYSSCVSQGTTSWSQGQTSP